jgi:N,N'-diacetylbacillosaminyl-diphospho-undecaprenol alpha-1,3-N-acetylgalactosaminyltransferase
VSSEQLEALKKEFGLSSEHKIVVMVARMAWTKGVKEFIEASQSVTQRIPEAKFFLVGPTETGSPENVPEAYLKEQETTGSFQWLGFRRDVKALYALADLAVLPSYYREGGYPRGITEAMSMGKPVVTTDSIHCCDTVEEGKNGYLVPVKDSKKLADAITSILIDKKKCKAFGEYSRRKAVKEFDENTIVSEVINKIFLNRDSDRGVPEVSN